MKHLSLSLPCLLLLVAACNGPDRTPDQPAAPAAAARPAPPAPAASPDSARRASFGWEDDACRYRGYFPAGQYTQQQLHDSYKLVTFPYASAAYEESIWHLPQFHPDSINTRLQQLEKQHRQERVELQALQVVALPYWQRLKKLRQQEEEELYQLRKLTLQAYYQPGLLRKAPRAGGCQDYVQALTATDSLQLLQGWRKLVDAQKKNNGAPEHLEAEYQLQLASAEPLRYARLHLMLFGWWNCANEHRQYVDLADEQQPWVAFEKLFAKVDRFDCEDVD